MTAQPSSQAEREDVALLPCPFCGAAAIWREDDPAAPYDPIGLIVDHARDCFLRGVVNFDKASITGTWNTRADREHATPRSMPGEVVEAYERAAKACESEAQVFLSPEYATGQPLSSVGERLACALCADAIRRLIPRASA